MRRHRLRSALAACSFLVAGLATGCGHATRTPAGPGLEKKTITVAEVPLVDEAALHVAVTQKLFQAEGLNVRVEPVTQSIAALPALKRGQLDVIAGANYVTFLQAHQQGTIDLRIISPGAAEAPRFMQLLVLPNSPIRTPKDLEGKTVAVNILNNIQSLTLNEVLKANHVDPAKVKYRAVPFPSMDKALKNHDVDAIHTADPFTTNFQQELGTRMVVDGGGAPVTGLPVSGYVTTREFVSKYPKTAAAFQRAMEKAQSLAGDRARVNAVLPSFAHVDAATAAKLNLPQYPTSLDPAGFQRLADLMLSAGLLKGAINVSDVLFQAPAK
ncbi:ABC transporter substrate-binding protein [Rugosimonospora acidiphila]|uniref:ABC transporter substrate-binding protein n=1 Tax=Rugosimonospora acidiphila TaxID=556531 RepID=A0ABP9RM49_9ACTN